MKLNDPQWLPPTDLKIIIVVDGEEITVKRPTFYLGNPSDDLIYIKPDGEILKGRYPWRYL